MGLKNVDTHFTGNTHTHCDDSVEHGQNSVIINVMKTSKSHFLQKQVSTTLNAMEALIKILAHFAEK